MRDFPEADWKILRSLSRIALDRFSKRILEEAAFVMVDPSKDHHERYLALFKLLHSRDRELGDAFNDLRRSSALIQLAHMRHHQLFTEEEFMKFSKETRDRVEGFLNL